MTPQRPGGRILVVDDDLLMRTMASSTLRHAGFEVADVDGGAAALAAFVQSPFDVLLLDVVMPDMDGYEVCRRIRSLPQGRRVQILMLTGLNDTDSIDLAYRAGATDFITKPINWSLLGHRVRYAIRSGAAVEAELRARESLERAQRLARMGHWEIRAADQALSCSRELLHMLFGDDTSARPMDPQDLLALVDEADRPRIAAARDAALREALPYQLTFGVRRRDGQALSVFEQAAPVLDAAGAIVAIEGITQDVTDRVEAERRIRHLAHYDTLTGLPNRQFFGELAQPALQRSRRHGSPCALLHIDMDRFKSVNDALGHAGGDAVLRQVAERLQTAVRASDLMAAGAQSSESIVARVGANAFTLLMDDVGSDRHVAVIAQRLLAAIAEPMVVEGRDLVLTASLGIALYPRDGGDIGRPDALRRAGRLRGQVQRAQAVPLLRRGHERRRQRAAGARRRSAPGHRRRPAASALPAQGRRRQRAARRCGGAGALAAPGARPGATGRIHPAGRAVRTDPAADALGAATPPVPTCGGVATPACPTLPVSVNLASPSFVHDDLLAQLDALLKRYGARTQLPDAGGHRVDADARRRARRAAPAGPARAGLRAVARRLRHRLLVAELPEALSDRRAEDRPVLHQRCDRRRARRRADGVDHLRWRAASA